MKKNVAIIGIGEVPTGRFPEQSAISFALESSMQAISHSGLKKDDIDMVIPTGSMFSSTFNTELVTGRIVEELGLKNVKRNMQVFSGGSSSSSIAQIAKSLIIAGDAKNILCVHADKLGTGVTSQEGIDLFSTAGISGEWEVPFGQHYSSVAALSTQRYLHETGCTNDHMSAVCISNRKWAELNPNAFFRNPLTLDEINNSKMLSSPLRAKQSNMLFDGGGAFIVSYIEENHDLPTKPIFILGESGRVTHFMTSQEPDLTRFGWSIAAKEAFRQAGITPSDIDVAEIYDSYPIYQLIAFEEIGLCRRGEGGEMFMNGDMAPGGKIPTTTDGGMLSKGHIGAGGGISLLIEAARQLMGEAGERQVKGAKFALETSTGGTYFDSQVTILGSEVP